MNNTKVDYQIVVMRFLALILILFHHSTTVFWGWPPSDLASMGAPWSIIFLSGLAKLYGLGTFTFISGFLLANSKQKQLSWSFIGHKAKKILLPCVIAAVVYYFFFSNFSGKRGPINGTHLWYLPMIFIFYLLLPIVHSQSLKKIILYSLFFVAINTILSKLTDYRTFDECGRYFCYFMSGAMMNKLLKSVKVDLYYVLTITFLTILFYGNILSIPTPICATIIIACFYYILQYFFSSKLYASFVNQHTKLYCGIKNFVVSISAQSFFIYILHQFIINLLIQYMPRDIPFFRLVLSTSCFVLSLFVPLCLLFLWRLIKKSIK
ncbi:MAG: acyltransferase [Prevotellaceae bacterium]|nr:acyltransferase [Prevotellaceae bacterium]